MQLPVYLDNNATTACDPRVLEAMLPYFSAKYGNAASRTHAFGWAAEEAVTEAREQVAHLIGARPKEIVFTSGATESNNLALKGAACRNRSHGDRLVTVATEHKAVLDPCKWLEQQGFQVAYLPVDRFGQVSASQVADALTERTILVSVMAANNEIGTLQPIRALGRLCKDRGILLHCDAAQAVGKIPIDVEDWGVDLLSISGHKLYGPKGLGALYVRRRDPYVRLDPIIHGGGHENGLRSGTLPVPLVVGLGKACALCAEGMAAEAEHCQQLRDRLRDGILERLEDVHQNGHPVERLPGSLNLSFGGVHGDALLMSLKNLAVSSGSACTSADPEPSYVLRALGISDELAHSSLRFGVGRFNTLAEIDYAVAAVVDQVQRLRAMNPLNDLAHLTV